MVLDKIYNLMCINSSGFLTTCDLICCFSYELMLDCWREMPSARPSFTAVRHALEAMIEQNSDVDYIHFPPINALQLDTEIEVDSDGLSESATSIKDNLHQRTHGPFNTDKRTRPTIGETSFENVEVPIVPSASETHTNLVSEGKDFVDKDVDDEVFDSATTIPMCDCSHHLTASAFDFGDSCLHCGKQQGLFQDRMKRLTTMVCHSEDRADDVSTGHGEFMLRSDCIRSDRIESDISSSTCSSGEFLIQQESSQKERSRSRDSEASVTSATYLLCSPKRLVIPSPPPTCCLEETRL